MSTQAKNKGSLMTHIILENLLEVEIRKQESGNAYLSPKYKQSQITI